MLFKVKEETRLEIYKTFDKNQEQVEEDVDTIVEWLKTQPHLPEIMKKNKIRNFLLLNKFSIEKTKQKIDTYYTVRSKMSEILDGSNLNLDGLSKTFIHAMHPMLLDEKYRISIVGPTGCGKYKIIDVIKFATNCNEVRLVEDCMFREIVIIDVAKTCMQDVMELSPFLIAKIALVFQPCNIVRLFRIYQPVEELYPMKVEAAYLINSPPFLSKVVGLFKAAINPKIFERIEIHTDDSILKKVFPKNMLPKDYGGDGPSLQEMIDMLQTKFVEYKDYFEELNKLQVNENLRPKPLANSTDLGYFGTFKQLNVD